MANMDVFAADAFSALEMTAALNKQDRLPSLLSRMGLFMPKPVRTEKVEIEERESKLALVQTSARGAPPNQRAKSKRNIRDFRTVRLAEGDTLRADEIQNIRAFGSESELMQVQTEVARKQLDLRRDIELTHENMRLGAVQGIVVDADGSTTLANFFTAFGITQPAEIDFDLDNAAPASGAVRKVCTQVVRQMKNSAKGGWVDSLTRVVGLAGDAFWDDLTAHPEVRETFLSTQAAAALREGVAHEQFNYGGITFVNYWGTDDGSTVAVGTDKCKFFPVNGNGVFEVAWSPAESFDFVNTPGQPFYSLVLPDLKRNAFVDIEVYSYPLFYCTRPGMLQRAKRT